MADLREEVLVVRQTKKTLIKESITLFFRRFPFWRGGGREDKFFRNTSIPEVRALPLEKIVRELLRFVRFFAHSIEFGKILFI